MEIEILELENIFEVQQIKEFLQVKPKLLDMFETVLNLANQKLQEKEPLTVAKKRLVSYSYRFLLTSSRYS